METNIDQRAKEISDFLSVPFEHAKWRLEQGFHFNHAKVAEDFRQRCASSSNENLLLEWYRTTDAYIWELTAYHLEEGFNYTGMMDGIVNNLLQQPHFSNVLVLGDGVGDLSIEASNKGLDAIYHDLSGSKTAHFATSRMVGKNVIKVLTVDWHPSFTYVRNVDAVIALDFLEHVTNVEEWTREIYNILSDGGLFLAQNAFGIGSGDDGSIPMHLAKNDHWTQDWSSLVESLGFTVEPGGWWRKTR